MRHRTPRHVSRTGYLAGVRGAPSVRSWVPQVALGAVVVVAVVLAAAGALLATGVLGSAPQPRLAPDRAEPAGNAERAGNAEQAGPVEKADLVEPAGADAAGQAGSPSSAGGPPGASAPRFTPGTVPRSGSEARRAWARSLLGRWDQARSRAWQEADPSALSALYVDGSSAGTRDVDLLGRWGDAGVEVRTLTLRLDEVDVVEAHPRRALLRVRDRLRVSALDSTAPSGGTDLLRLGRDRPSTRLVELRVQEGRWRVSRVRPAAPG